MIEPHVAQALRAGGRRVVITGATGWLGRATLDLLRAALGDSFPERVRCFGSQARTLELADGTAIEQRPLAQIAALGPCPTFVLHFAFLTKDRAEAMDEAEYRSANAAISGTVLAALDAIGADGVLVASSGAAAFADDATASPAMRLYGRLKRDDEDAFARWAERDGKTAVIPRIFNIAGPHINKHGSYALAGFILDALRGGPIVVKATGEVVRGYVAVRELMSLGLALLTAGKRGAIRFDTGGEPLEMGEIAARVAAQLGGCAVERAARDPAAPPNVYAGDQAGYALLLDEHRIQPVSFAQQIAETADFLMGIQSHSATNGVAARTEA